MRASRGMNKDWAMIDLPDAEGYPDKAEKDDKAGEEVHKHINAGGPAQAITDAGRRDRQAVVVIHGIGEQRPDMFGRQLGE